MDIKKAASVLGIDINRVLSDVEINNLNNMPFKKAQPMIEDAFKKAGRKPDYNRLVAQLGMG